MSTSIDQSVGLAQARALQATDDGVLGFAKGKKPANEAQIRKVSEQFESIFLNLVLKTMRKSVQKSGLLDGGNAEKIYSSMLDQQYAQLMAQQHHTGIADNIEDFLLRAQGDVRPAPVSPKALAIEAYQGSGLQSAAKSATMNSSAVPSVLPSAQSQLSHVTAGAKPKAL